MRNSIKQVLSAYIAKYSNIGYFYGLNFIVGFLLCICSKEKAFIILSFMIDKIFKPEFFYGMKNGQTYKKFESHKFFI
jgi:hypothetical protein